MTEVAASRLTAAQVVELLGLAPHPEGGFYRETFRDGAVPADARAASSAIYFLLAAGQRSFWHRVDAAEVWHFHCGAPLALDIAPPVGPPRSIRLGVDLATGERPQAVVPAGHWQRAESLGDWTLVSCTVAPAFLFERFEMAPPGFEPA